MATYKSLPPDIFPAFNPALVEFYDDGAEIYLTVQREDGSVAMFKRNPIRGIATFNLSEIIKKDFLINSNSSELICDQYLSRSYIVKGVVPSRYIDWISEGSDNSSNSSKPVGQPITPITLLALNAVEQIGKSCDYTKQTGTLRTCFDKIIQYSGYPCTITILGFGRDTHFSFNGNDEAQPHTEYSLFSKKLPDNTREIKVSQNKETTFLANSKGKRVTTEQGDNIIIFLEEEVTDRSIKVENRCLPENPFYIRWINQLAGWDYWMFSFRQIKESKMLNQQTYSPSVFNTESAYTFTEEFHKEAEEFITVGAEGLTPNEFEGLRKIPYSPRVEMYDKETNRWYRLMPEEGSVGEDTNDSTKTIELTFRLPEPQIQV